ncbi:Oligopeptide ABC transporter, periplasmic oligopeptide-binding protein OppA [Rhodopirellula islandica]|uniref:Oligopeptide ABC transporter, periplasmic oligopeptide-binding protein OppA n=1 Tax=Rhodopirellula islandica TaxID=595434 RepID=A0A0J1B7W8_RHOIS|nr:extracellular solute-binding protein [Rhodopirellula islandica]KLU02895.1 Oligopeptide ABC transporter, periplasmic oligopeptide-binding protein OppA [Rhodopirellula islandica]
MNLNRRELLGATLATVAVAGAKPVKASDVFSAPAIHVSGKPVVRVLGTHVTLQEDLRVRAEADLGIQLEFTPGGSAEVLHRASTRPESFDLYEQWSNSIRVLWQAGAIQPIDRTRIRYWDEINPLTRVGRLTPEAKIGAGDAPNELLFIQPDGTLGGQSTEQISFLPYVHNVDSFGYDASFVPRGIPYETESWAWLLDDRWAGKVAIVNEPTIGLFDLAMAVQAKGLAEFGDIGNLSEAELETLFQILEDYRRSGHFRGVWSSVPSSVGLMSRGEVVIESMFSPAVFELRGRGIECVNASPKEGYRAWHGVMCLSSRTSGSVKDAAYEYMNWWLSGWPGAFIARQGYYISNPQRSREELSEAEWDYWYEGKPATTDLQGTTGRVVVKEGQARDGGSYEKRFCNIAVWNTVMKSYEASLRHWNEFVSG